MKVFLPLFPLELVVFPGEHLRLHVFEPRYKQLINECHDANTTFGIPAYINGGVAEFGTEMTLEQIIKTYEDGEMDILTKGQRVFRLERFLREVPSKLYSGGEVIFLENKETTSSMPKEALSKRFRRLHELLETGYEREDFESPNLSFQLGQEVGLTMYQKVRLLSLERESEREALIIEHMDEVIPKLEAAGETKRRIGGNGHFYKFPTLEL
ncbi:MAG: LON peptidase substrate-binding domain-containing protein [Candidatus Hydrogenedentota bacterium]